MDFCMNFEFECASTHEHAYHFLSLIPSPAPSIAFYDTKRDHDDARHKVVKLPINFIDLVIIRWVNTVKTPTLVVIMLLFLVLFARVNFDADAGESSKKQDDQAYPCNGSKSYAFSFDDDAIDHHSAHEAEYGNVVEEFEARPS